MKINAPKHWEDSEGFLYGDRVNGDGRWMRCVDDRDWRKIMAVVRAVERDSDIGEVNPCLDDVLTALRKHLAKK